MRNNNKHHFLTFFFLIILSIQRVFLNIRLSRSPFADSTMSYWSPIAMSIRDDGEHMFLLVFFYQFLSSLLIADTSPAMHIFSRLCLFKERIPTHAIVDVLVILEENWFTHVSNPCDLSSNLESYSKTNSCKHFYSSLMKDFELR